MRRLVALGGAMLLLGAPAPAQSAPAEASDPRAARTLARGETVTLESLVGGDSLAVNAAVVGLVTRRVIREGEALRHPAVGRPSVLRAGAAVTVRVPSARVTITRHGIALAEAGVGDTVLVRLDRSTSVAAAVLDARTVTLLPALPH